MKKTDWTTYYGKRRLVTSYTRSITEKNLIEFLTVYSTHLPAQNCEVLEIGGAGSCFFEAVYNALSPRSYTVIDNNEFGVKKFLEDNVKYGEKINALNEDILHFGSDKKFDIVFSVGLIEHFNVNDTAKVIAAHFRLCRKGGLVVIGFPTPTVQYKITRSLMEFIRVWKFFDERPLLPAETEPEFSRYGEVLNKRLLNKMPLTQMVYAIKAG